MVKEKTDLSVGDILWLPLLPGDSSGTGIQRNLDHYYCDEFDRFHNSPSPVSEAVKARYTAMGLDRDFCDHPCIMTDLLDGTNGTDSNESKVMVCIVSVLGFLLVSIRTSLTRSIDDFEKCEISTQLFGNLSETANDRSSRRATKVGA